MINKEFFAKNKEHILFIGLLLLLPIIFFWQFLTTNMTSGSNLLTYYYQMFSVVKESVLIYHQFPHWTPYIEAGFPLFANAQNPTFIFYTWPLVFLIPNLSLALNLSVILASFLMGLTMYILCFNLGLKPRYAFASGIVFMFASMHIIVVKSWPHRASVIFLTPLILLFLYKALTTKKWLLYSILAGVFLGASFLADAIDYFLITVVPFGLLFLVYVINKNWKQKLMKAALVFGIAFLLLLGLASIKLFPLLEFGKISSKEGSFSYEQSFGNVLKTKDLMKLPLSGSVTPHEDGARTGIIAFILMLLAIPLIKSRKILLFYLLGIIILLEATGTPVHYLFWKLIPGFDKVHHVIRFLFLYILAVAALAGFGMAWALAKLQEKYKLKEKTITLLYVLFVIGIIVELALISPKGFGFPVTKQMKESLEQQLVDLPILQYVVEQPGYFRIHTWGANMLGGNSGVFSTNLGLYNIHPSGSIWIPEFFNEFRGVAHQNPAVFYGILNVKFILSDQILNISGLTLIKEFPECEKCHLTTDVDMGLDGPYLYQNDYALPRAFTGKNAVLVAGEKNAVKNLMYGLMLSPEYDPRKMMIFMHEGLVNNIPTAMMNSMDAVVLTQGSVDQSSMIILDAYVKQGGRLYPDIVHGNTTLTSQDIQSLLLSYQDEARVEELPITLYSPNRIEVNIDKSEPFVVLSEKFFLFEGWKVKLNGRTIPFSRVDGIISGIYTGGETGKLVVEYKSTSFRIGAIITIITFFIIIIALAMIFYNREKAGQNMSH